MTKLDHLPQILSLPFLSCFLSPLNFVPSPLPSPPLFFLNPPPKGPIMMMEYSTRVWVPPFLRPKWLSRSRLLFQRINYVLGVRPMTLLSKSFFFCNLCQIPNLVPGWWTLPRHRFTSLATVDFCLGDFVKVAPFLYSNLSIHLVSIDQLGLGMGWPFFPPTYNLCANHTVHHRFTKSY